MSELHFEASDHSYTFRGVRVPSVTQILKEEGFTPPYNNKYNATGRGTLIHEATAAYDRWEFYDVPKKFEGYIKAYISWSESEGFAYEYIETPMVHTKLYFAGTPDRITTKGLLIDVKTGKPSKSHQIQTAAYAMLSPITIKHRGCLYLQEDGKHLWKPYEDKEDFKVFDNALYNYNWKRSHK